MENSGPPQAAPAGLAGKPKFVCPKSQQCFVPEVCPKGGSSGAAGFRRGK